MDYINAFIFGGFICMLGQILIDKTNIGSAKILVTFLILGSILSSLGIYKYLQDIGGAGIDVTILGFGNLLVEETKKGIDSQGFLGVFSGLSAISIGLSWIICLAFISSLFFDSKGDI